MLSVWGLTLMIAAFAAGQFKNGRRLEPPVPSLCAQSKYIRHILVTWQVSRLWGSIGIEYSHRIRIYLVNTTGWNPERSFTTATPPLKNGIGIYRINDFLGIIHEQFEGKGYFFSWRSPETQGKEEDWLGTRNWCRQRCMDAPSLNTNAKNEYIKSKLIQGNTNKEQACTRPARVGIWVYSHHVGWTYTKNFISDKVKYIWTSGRVCDFKDCETRPDLMPKRINGWFWTSDLQKLPPVTDRVHNDWSESGG